MGLLQLVLGQSKLMLELDRLQPAGQRGLAVGQVLQGCQTRGAPHRCWQRHGAGQGQPHLQVPLGGQLGMAPATCPVQVSMHVSTGCRPRFQQGAQALQDSAQATQPGAGATCGTLSEAGAA